MKPRDCLTPVLIAVVLGAGIATFLCAIMISGRMQRLKAEAPPPFHMAPGYEYIPRVPGSTMQQVMPGECGQANVGGSWHRIECPKVQP